MKGYVYVIEGMRNGKKVLYVGCTKRNVWVRFHEHQQGIGGSYTKSMQKLRLIFVVVVNASNVYAVEYRFKSNKHALRTLMQGKESKTTQNFYQWVNQKHIEIIKYVRGEDIEQLRENSI